MKIHIILIGLILLSGCVPMAEQQRICKEYCTVKNNWAASEIFVGECRCYNPEGELISIEEANQTEEARLFIPSDDEGYIRINCNNFKNISDLPLMRNYFSLTFSSPVRF